ncbi:MAG TPA: ABC transporter permease [Candidatus Limiplasma sp.]|nr:ABC transporter permease [Candidatus Limiplasma sp.]HRX08018.1 ABC transporter permease [Candidatus Limiplasma sp.]
MTKLRNNSLIKKLGVQRLVITGVLIILFVFFYAMSPSFRKYSTIVTMTSYMYYIMLMAIGVTFPLITGGVDLSIGTGLVCYSIVGSFLMRQMGLPIWVAMLVTVGMGIFFGFFNGIIIAKLNLPPFITTLCTMMIVRGLGSILTGGMTGVWPMAGQDGSWFRDLLKYKINGTIYPVGLVFIILLVIFMSIVLNHSRVGRYIIAIGSNKEALKLSGVNVVRWHVMAYVFSGFFAGLAAIAYAGTFTSITPGTGAGLELDAIGGAIIGGTAMTGGSGSIVGTFLGVCLISLLKTGLPNVGLQANWQQIITGSILIVAVTIDMIRRRK